MKKLLLFVLLLLFLQGCYIGIDPWHDGHGHGGYRGHYWSGGHQTSGGYDWGGNRHR